VTDIALSHDPPDAPGLRRLQALVTSPTADLYLRSGLALLLVAVAYHYSLETLFRSLTTETPLAYLGLVPFFALFLAAFQIRPTLDEHPIHDRQIDYIIGLPLLTTAVGFNLIMPVRLSTMFWLWRLDVVSLPIFTAGVIALLFGTRTLWRLKIPVLFLILAWPLPYTSFLVSWLNTFTNTTLAALNFVLHYIRVAKPLLNEGAGIYQIRHGHSDFQVGVVSACSGVNGFVGYALVAIAFLVVVTGAWFRKAAWLALGLVASWVSNVIRIVIVIMVGHLAGETIAIDVLHPVIGLVMFNLVVLGMLLVVRRFGLQVPFMNSAGDRRAATDVRRAVPKISLATAIVVVFVLIGALTNSSLRSYDLVESTLGEPRLTAFTTQQSAPPGWTPIHTDTYTWATPFFGQDSTWLRFEFYSNGTGPLRAATPIIADVINTSDLNSFSTYGIEACYRFHGFKLYSIQTVDLGNGVAGNALTYYNTQAKSDWTTVYWHWPVKTPEGKTRYERMTLMMINAGAVQYPQSAAPGLTRSIGLGVQNAVSGTTSKDVKLARTRAFLIAFARSLIAQQAAMSAKATTSSPSVAT